MAAQSPLPNLTTLLPDGMMTTRFPTIPQEKWTDAQREFAAEITAGPRGQLRGPFVPLLYSPGLASRVQQVGEYLRFNNRLPEPLVELAILVMARRYNCVNIWQSHRILARKCGLSPHIIAAVAETRYPDNLTDEESAVYDFATELGQTISVSDATFDRLVTMWDRSTAIDLIGVCGYYVMLAMVLNTAKIPLPDGEPPFQP